MHQVHVLGRLLGLRHAIEKSHADAETIRTVRQEFIDAARDDDGPADTQEIRNILADLVGHVFDETVMIDPSHLPDLFPLLAATCGIRGDDEQFAHIDWSVLEHFKQSPLAKRLAG